MSNTWLSADRLFRAVNRVYEAEAKTFGLPVIEFQIMHALYGRDGQNATQLAGAVGRAPTSFTPILDNLVEKGLIERRPDRGGDRRALRIHLTPDGERLRHQVLESHASAEAEARRIAGEWMEERRETERMAVSDFLSQQA